MKHLVYLIIPAVICSCAGESSNSETNSTNEVSNDSGMVDQDGMEDLESVEIKENDWLTENLTGSVKRITIHTYNVDENGEEIGMGGYHETKEFDEYGFITEISSSGCCGAGLEQILYKRNSDNQLTHRIFKVDYEYNDITDETPLDHKEKYFYDKEGVLVKMKIAGADSVLTREHIYKYNKEGELTEEKIVPADDTPFTIKYSGDIYERKESFEFDDATKNYQHSESYNSEGLVDMEQLFMSNGKVFQTRFKHEFDNNGNWTQRTAESRYINEDGSKEDWYLSYKETRKITYY